MGIRSHVCVAIAGSYDKLDFLRRMAPDFFEYSDIYQSDTIRPESSRFILYWENNYIKWNLDYASLTNYPELRQFELIWQLAEKWGLDGKYIEFCYEYPDFENGFNIINNGNELEYPRLEVGISMPSLTKNDPNDH